MSSIYRVYQNYRPPFIFGIFQQRRIVRSNLNSDLNSSGNSFSIKFSIGQNLKRNFLKRVFQKPVPLKSQVLEEFDKNVFVHSNLKERKMLSKMRSRPALQAVPFQSYKHQKNRKNNVFSRFFKVF
jgi:hypothetical protein